MTWSLVLALLWIALLVPVGYVLGRALRRVDDRDAARPPVEAPVTAAPPTTVPVPFDPTSAPVPDGFSRHA